jgi:hypothetical protein
MDDDMDLLSLFTAACLNHGREGEDAVEQAIIAANALERHREEQLDFFGGDCDQTEG